MAGASADPSSNGVYLSQMLTVPTLPSGTWWKVRVNKILGVNKPDLVPISFSAPATVSLDTPFVVTITAMNQGDAFMPGSLGKIYLTFFDTINPGTDTVIGTFNLPALGINGSTTVNVTCTIPSSLGGLNGTWTIGPALDRGLAASEQSEVNNYNSFLAGLHGNAHIVIQ
jgi:hypothetical protein